MGAAGFHGRVRDGVGWGTRAMTTRSIKQPLTAARSSRASGEGGRDAVEPNRESYQPTTIL